MRVTTEAMPWRRGDSRRLAGVSSFGFSGTNAHVVLEEAPPTSPTVAATDRPLHILTLSARSEPALMELLERYRQMLDKTTAPLADLCFTANAGRSHFDHRLAIVARTRDGLRQRLADARAGRDVPGLHRGVLADEIRPRLVFLFPDVTGSHGRQLFDTQPTFRQALQHAEELLRPHLGTEPPEARFASSAAPPKSLRFALQYALAELWRSWGITPDAVRGDGIGEYAAACMAGTLSLEEASARVATRAPADFAQPPVRLNDGVHECEVILTLLPGVDEWDALLTELAGLYVAGVPVDWDGFDRDYPRHKVSVPTYPFQRSRHGSRFRRTPPRRPPPVHPVLGEKRAAASDEIVHADRP